MEFRPEDLDFDRCEEEPIHRPEAIQSFGYLIAIDPDSRRVRLCSENVHELFEDRTAVELVGEDFFELLEPETSSAEFLEASFLRAKEASVRLPVELGFRENVLSAGRRRNFHAVVFESDGLMVIEAEPASTYSALVEAQQQGKIYANTVLPRFAQVGDVEELAASVAETVRRLTGFERVVVYRFNADMTGTVIGESKVDGVDAYLGLTYPANDIPAQARELYRTNWTRLNPDAKAPAVGIVPTIEETGRPPLDLTQSFVRAMSPIHVKYLENLGARSSMSISLVCQRRLWGLIACHHREPHYVPQSIRLECESLGFLFAWQFYAKEEEIVARRKSQAEKTVDDLVEGLGEGKSLLDIFRDKERDVLDLIGASGFAFLSSQQRVMLGTTPSPDVVEKLARTVVHGHEVRAYRVESLREVLGAEADALPVCGALVIPLTPSGEYVTVWFRPEHARKIRWAGVPGEKDPAASKEERLSPRASFEIHEEIIRDHSKPWSDDDVETALRLNKLFFQHALQREVEVRADIDQLEMKDEAKNRFLATLGHELRNPLSPISHAISILKSAEDGKLEKRAFEILERQLDNLTVLVDDLLDVSRITRGKINLEKSRIDLRAVLESALEVNQRLIEQKEHVVDFHRPGDPIFLQGDFARLTQVFGNIIHNAAKYTPNGGHIEVSVEIRDGEVVIVRVEDDGVGIPSKELTSIFEIFSQVDAKSTKTRGGLGIGLTLARELVKAHGGDIEVESEGLDRGSRFSIRMPLGSEEAAPSLTADEAEEERAEVSRRRVLVVEDNEDVLDMLASLLRLKGHDVRTCTTAAGALEAFSEHSPQVVLLDIGLPDMDGYELCAKMKTQPGGENAVYVAQTGWGQADDKRRAKEAGFDHHLTKPVGPKVLDALFDSLFS